MTGAALPLQQQVFSVAILLLFVGWLLYLVRYHRLSLRDTLLWLVSTCAAMVVAVFPQTLRWLATALDIAVPSNALFAVAFLYVLLNLLALTVSMSGHAARARRLAQECALLRAELDVLRDRLDGALPANRREP